jgi:hypothetical protein
MHAEPDRKPKRIAVALSAADAAIIPRTSALEGLPSSRLVGRLICDDIAIEQRGRILLDRPDWPPPPTDPRCAGGI